MRKLFKFLFWALTLLVLFVFAVDAYVSRSVKKQLHDQVATVGYNKVGLVLGTSKYVGTGRVNLYYKYRINAAVQLYKSRKIDYIIVSGDNRQTNYNEPKTMMQDLVDAGVPRERIFLDYAGFRTLDSVVRCKAIFKTTDVTIISQKFHNERAVFIANKKGLNASAFNAKDPPIEIGLKVLIREKLARVKMVLDLIVNKQPKFYGPPVEIK